MQNLIIKILTSMFYKLMAEGFVYKFIARMLWQASQLTTNKVDDGVVEDIADRLEVTDYK